MRGWLVRDSKSIVQTSHVIFGGDEGDADFSWESFCTERRYRQSKRPSKFDLGIILEQPMDFVGIEMGPTFDDLGRRGFGGDHRPGLWPKLKKRLLVAVVRLLLGHDDHVRFLNIRQMPDCTGNFVLGPGKPWRGDDRRPVQPWVYQDAERTTCGGQVGRRRVRFWGEEEQERRVGIEVSDCDRHGV